jgi:hypothetical protein
MELKVKTYIRVYSLHFKNGWIGGEVPKSLVEYLLDVFGGLIKCFVDEASSKYLCYLLWMKFSQVISILSTYDLWQT